MLATALFSLLVALPVMAPEDFPGDPLATLSRTLADPVDSQAALVALQATRDKGLAPLFVALCRSEEPARRRFALDAVVQLLGGEAADTLRERLQKDKSKSIRIAAMTHLIELQAMDPQEIRLLLGSNDEEIQSLAAGALAALGQGQSVLGLLTSLARSDNLAISNAAKLALVRLGYHEHLRSLQRVISDEATIELVVLRLLEQIEDEGIAAASDLAKRATTAGRSVRVRMAAWRALCQADPSAATLLYDAISQTDHTVLSVRLLRLLSDCVGGKAKLGSLSRRQDSVGKLARFELARRQGGGPASEAIAAALACPHPIVVEYVLARAAEDVESGPSSAEFYVPALLSFIKSYKLTSDQIRPEHYQLATASTILADLGTTEAMAGLKMLLAGRYSANVRAVAAGLLRSKNKGVCELASGILDSPYSELSSDAALVLCSFGDVAGVPKLRALAFQSDKQVTSVQTMACWYLLKTAGRSKLAAAKLAAQVR